MAVSAFSPFPLAAVAPQLPEVDAHENADGDAVTKLRSLPPQLRSTSFDHPGDSPKWWLCAPCRTRLLGDETRTSSRWSS